MTVWLYDTERHADRLDACVSRAKGWPEGGTKNWSDPRMIDNEDHDLYGMYYVAAPPKDVREQARADCPPDLEREHSSDWHPEPEI